MDNFVEQLGDDVIKEWNPDQSLFKFMLANSSRATVDIYIEGNLEILRDWNNQYPIYEIQDLTHKDLSFTPYLKARINDITSLIKEREITAYVAIVVTNNLTGQFIKAFGRIFEASQRTQFFDDMSQAQTWIEKMQSETK